MRKIFPACCASALAPHTMSATTIAKSPVHFRFWILRLSSPRQARGLSLSKAVQVFDFRLLEKESSHRTQDLLFILSAPNLKSAMVRLPHHRSKIQNYSTLLSWLYSGLWYRISPRDENKGPTGEKPVGPKNYVSELQPERSRPEGIQIFSSVRTAYRCYPSVLSVAVIQSPPKYLFPYHT